MYVQSAVLQRSVSCDHSPLRESDTVNSFSFHHVLHPLEAKVSDLLHIGQR